MNSQTIAKAISTTRNDEVIEPFHQAQADAHLPNEILALIAEHCVDQYDVWCVFDDRRDSRPLQRRMTDDSKAEICSENNTATVSVAFSIGIRRGIKKQYTGNLYLQSSFGWSSNEVNAQTVIEKHDLQWIKTRTTYIKIWSQSYKPFMNIDFNQMPNLTIITAAFGCLSYLAIMNEDERQYVVDNCFGHDVQATLDLVGRTSKEALKMDSLADSVQVILTRVFAFGNTPRQFIRATADTTGSLPVAVSKEVLHHEYDQALR